MKESSQEPSTGRQTEPRKSRMLRLPYQTEGTLLQARKRLWSARGRKRRQLGTALLGVSLLMFLLAYLTNRLIFELTSVLSLFLGTAFLFTEMESYVKSGSANAIAKSLMVSLRDALKYAGLPKGKVFYYYDQEDKPRMSFDGEQGLAIDDPGAKKKRGIYPIGSDLVRLYEDELGDLKDRGLEYISEWLPRVISDGLKLAEGVEFTTDNNCIKVLITKPAYGALCFSEDIKDDVLARVGCPLGASIAQAIARAAGAMVLFAGCAHDPNSGISVLTYELSQR